MNEDRNGPAFPDFLLKLGKLASIIFDHNRETSVQDPPKADEEMGEGEGENTVPFTGLGWFWSHR